jgi:hypothetical protein
LIPLWRGFYFSEDMLSDVHTVDVSYRRTKPWCLLVGHGNKKRIQYGLLGSHKMDGVN